MWDEPNPTAAQPCSRQPLMKPLTSANLRLHKAVPQAEKKPAPVYTPNEDEISCTPSRRTRRSRLVEREQSVPKTDSAPTSADDLWPSGNAASEAEAAAVPPQAGGFPQKIYAVPYYIQPDQNAYKQGMPVYLPLTELSSGQRADEGAPVPAMPTMLFMPGNDGFSASHGDDLSSLHTDSEPMGDDFRWDEVMASAAVNAADTASGIATSAAGIVAETAASNADDSFAGAAADAPPYINAADPDIDENEDAADAMPSEEMAAPVPIAFTEMQTVSRRRRVWPWIVALCLVMAVASVIALWKIGYLPFKSSRLPIAVNTLNSDELSDGDAAKGVTVKGDAAEGVAAAADMTVIDNVKVIQSFTAEKITGSAPISVVFTAVTDTDISAVNLIDDAGELINVAITSQQVGNLTKWSLIASFEKPYSGIVHACYCDLDGYWVDDGSGVQVDFE